MWMLSGGARVALPVTFSVMIILVASACASSTPATAPPSGPSPTTVPLSPSPEPTPPTTVVASASPEPGLQLLWEKGGPKPERAGTASPTIDPDGRIWVANVWASEFWIFTPDGEFVEAWGDQGSGDGQLDFVYQGKDAIGGIAFADDGSFYTFDAGNFRVQRFDAERKFLDSWGGFGSGEGQFSKPTAIAVDAQGLVYVADGARADVQVFDPDGAYLRTIAAGHAGVPYNFSYMAVDPAGFVYLNERNRILKYASDGTALAAYDFSAFAPDQTPSAVDRDGDLFVTTWSADDTQISLVEIDPDGGVLHVWPEIGEELVLDGAGGAYTTQYHWSFARKFAVPTG